MDDPRNLDAIVVGNSPHSYRRKSLNVDSAVVVVVRLLSDEIEAAIPMLLGDAKANTRTKAV